MWRPETIKEKEAREHPKAVEKPIGNKPVVQHDQLADAQALEAAGCGWVTACAKVIEYVVCCCGCCSSYESYYEND